MTQVVSNSGHWQLKLLATQVFGNSSRSQLKTFATQVIRNVLNVTSCYKLKLNQHNLVLQLTQLKVKTRVVAPLRVT